MRKETQVMSILKCLPNLYIFEKTKNKESLKQNEKKYALLYPGLKHFLKEQYRFELNKKMQLPQPTTK